MNDLISRQAAIKYLMTNMNWYDEDGYESDDDFKRECKTELINGVPSAQPDERMLHESCTDCPLYDKDRHSCPRFNKVIPVTLRELQSAQPEQRWIPVSERMPGEHELLGTKKFGTTISNEVYVTFEAPDGQRFAKHISFQNGKLSPVDEQRMKVWFKGAKPIAWMPLPEPYRPEGSRDENKT